MKKVNLVLLSLRFMVETQLCPDETKGKNVFPTSRPPERNQYENSRKWYLNISWDSLPGRSSCHRIFMAALTMSMAKILYVLNDTSLTLLTILYWNYLHHGLKTASVMKTYVTTKTRSKYLKAKLCHR